MKKWSFEDKAVLTSIIILIACAWVSGYLIGSEPKASTTKLVADSQQPVEDSLTGFTIKADPRAHEFFLHIPDEQKIIAAFLLEPNPNMHGFIDLDRVVIRILENKGLKLKDMKLEVDNVPYEPAGTVGANDLYFARPPHYRNIGLSESEPTRIAIYAAIDSKSNPGTYSLPLRINDWYASRGGKTVPISMVVNGQPLVVVP